MAKIAVYAGHGGDDPGAAGNGYTEKDVNLALSNAVSAILRDKGHTVINNRTTDLNRSITQDANRANSENADAVVEIHLNSNAGTPSSGSEVYYSAFDRGTGHALASAIVENLAALGFHDRGVKTRLNSSGRDSLGIIRLTRAPAVLVETAFINNADDMARLDISAAAKAIADGILKVFPAPAAAPAPTAEGANSVIRRIQETLNQRYNAGLRTDGIWGSRTRAAIVKGWQSELNRQYGKRLATDGIWGPSTSQATVSILPGAAGNLTYLLQAALYGRGYRHSVPDGIWGSRTGTMVKAFQNDSGLTPDGIAGRLTQSALFK